MNVYTCVPTQIKIWFQNRRSKFKKVNHVPIGSPSSQSQGQGDQSRGGRQALTSPDAVAVPPGVSINSPTFSSSSSFDSEQQQQQQQQQNQRAGVSPDSTVVNDSLLMHLPVAASKRKRGTSNTNNSEEEGNQLYAPLADADDNIEQLQQQRQRQVGDVVRVFRTPSTPTAVSSHAQLRQQHYFALTANITTGNEMKSGGDRDGSVRGGEDYCKYELPRASSLVNFWPSSLKVKATSQATAAAAAAVSDPSPSAVSLTPNQMITSSQEIDGEISAKVKAGGGGGGLLQYDLPSQKEPEMEAQVIPDLNIYPLPAQQQTPYQAGHVIFTTPPQFYSLPADVGDEWDYDNPSSAESQQ
jgi:hypothetical protein